MTTSDASWSPSLRKVTDLERGDHWYLRESDQCYFFGEYTPGKGWAHSQTNQLVLNLKILPALRMSPSSFFPPYVAGVCDRASTG